jgi:tetratricopeptide (TPR) repeat protein
MFLRNLLLLCLLGVSFSLTGCEKVNQRRARRMTNQAVQMMRAEQYTNAKGILRESIQLYPYDAQAYYMLGRAHQASEELADAIQAYTRSIALDATNKSAHLNLGHLYLKAKEPTKAIPPYEKAVELNPQDAKYHYQLGLAYQGAKRFPKAAESFEKAISLEAKFTDAHNALAANWLDQAKEHEPPPPEPKPEEEDPKKKKKGKKEPEPPPTILQPIAEAAKPFYKKAEDAILRALRNQAANSQSYTLLALAYIKQHQFEEAVKICQQAKTGNIYDASATFHMGLAYDLWFEKLRMQAFGEKDEKQRTTIERDAAEKRDKALDTLKEFLQLRGGDENAKMDARMKIRNLTELKEKELAKQIEKEKKKRPRRRRR